MFNIWLGNEASFELLNRYETEYRFKPDAFAPTAFTGDRMPQIEPVFGVSEDRIGLTVLEMVGETPVIKVHGSLTPNFRAWHAWFPGEVTSYEALKDGIAILMEAGHKRVVMDINSGGGAVRGLNTVTEQMDVAKAGGMAILAHTDSAAFSAAYWIAAGANKLSASKMAEVGSIGTLAVVETYANTEENFGVKFTVFKAGKFKALGNPFEELTQEAKDYLQNNINDTNQFFLDHVSAKRNLSLANTDAWAEGQTFYAAKALKNGLIDSIGKLDDLITRGAAANTSDYRRFEMPISPEKLAQIAAGADPKDVLTTAELKMYNDGLQAQADEEAAAKGEGDEKQPGDDEEEDDSEKEPAAPTAETKFTVTAEEHGTLRKELRQSMKDNGKLEAKLEAQAEKIEALEAQVWGAKEMSDSLLIVAQAAVTNLQRALQKPFEAKATANEVIGQYTELSGLMAKTFKQGQQSKETSTKDSTTSAAETNVRFLQLDKKSR
jgi:signal peptide peptidase SppA